MKKVKIFVAALAAAVVAISFAACGEKCASGHSYGEWTVTVAATCTEDGTETRKCSVCDKEETRPIAKLGHNYEYAEMIFAADGKTAQAKYVCSHDATHTKMHDATVTAAVKTAATCEAKGTTTYTATYDGHSATKDVVDIDALGHNYGDPVYAERDGKLVTVRKCSRCDRELVTIVKDGVAVHNRDELETAVKINGAYIVLMNDIVKVGANDLGLRPYGKDHSITIDLNGKTIASRISARTAWDGVKDCGFNLTVKILNGNVGTADGYVADVKDAANVIAYAIMINGGRVNLTIEKVNMIGYYGGFYTNGSNAGSTATISNSAIKGVNGGASYLAGGHTVTFDNCEFEGGFGLYVKSGNVTLNGCAVRATGAYEQPNYNGNGADGGGSGIVVDSVEGYTPSLTFVMNDGSISSAYGYAFEQVVTKGDNYSTSTLDGVSMTAGKDPNVFVTTEGAVTVR